LYTVLAAGQECVHRQLVRGVQAGARCNSPDVTVSAYCLLGYFVLSGVENRRKKAILRRDSSSQQGMVVHDSLGADEETPEARRECYVPCRTRLYAPDSSGQKCCNLQQVASTAPRTTGWRLTSPHILFYL
jgi:hypothetical protein